MRTSSVNKEHLKRYSSGHYHNTEGGYLDVDIQIAFAEEVTKILKAAKISKVNFVCKGNSSHVLAAATCIVCRQEGIDVSMMNAEHMCNPIEPTGPIWLLDDCIHLGRAFKLCNDTLKDKWKRGVDRMVVIESTKACKDSSWASVGLYDLVFLK